jgi:hypothetical protein
VPNLSLQPVRIAADGDEEGLLVFGDGRLVAVLVRLSGRHGAMSGRWFLEVGFGPALDPVLRPTFPDLETAQHWIAGCLQHAEAAG